MIDLNGQRVAPLFALLHGGGGGLPMASVKARAQPGYKFKTAFGSTATTFGAVSLRAPSPPRTSSARTAATSNDREWAPVPPDAARFISPRQPASGIAQGLTVIHASDLSRPAPRSAGPPSLLTASRGRRPVGSNNEPPAPPRAARTSGSSKIVAMRRAHAKPRHRKSNSKVGRDAAAEGPKATADDELQEELDAASVMPAPPTVTYLGASAGLPFEGMPKCEVRITLLGSGDEPFEPQMLRVVLDVDGFSACDKAAVQVQSAWRGYEARSDVRQQRGRAGAEVEAQATFSSILAEHEAFFEQMKKRLMDESASAIQLAVRTKLSRRQAS